VNLDHQAIGTRRDPGQGEALDELALPGGVAGVKDVENMRLSSATLRIGLIAVITIVGLQTGTLLGGAVVIETVFARQGIGRLAVIGIKGKDFPLVQPIVLLAAVVDVVSIAFARHGG